MPTKPKIAIIMDENTSSGGNKYEANKLYFQGIINAGGLPFGVPYFHEIEESVVSDFDGLLCVGGRFAYPDSWYIGSEAPKSPTSERFEVERNLVKRYLSLDKPVLGICAGMQMIACVYGSRMSPDLKTLVSSPLEHDERGICHTIYISKGSLLHSILGQDELAVNSFHREALAAVASEIDVSARTDDGIVEAIEVPGKRFAIGIQWHQELHVPETHAGNLIFAAFVDSCRARI